MIPIDRIAAVLLCGGLSERFGADNKLLAPLGGKPLVAHAAGLIADIPFGWRLAVTGGDAEIDRLLAEAGFERHANPKPERGQDSSVRIGLSAAMVHDPAAVLICLGDMPYVPGEHLAALADAADPVTAAASSDGTSMTPPVLLPAGLCAQVLAEPDRPVRSFLVGSVRVIAPSGTLRDFDTRADFEAG